MSSSSDAGPSTRPEASEGKRPIRTGTWRDEQTPPREADLEEVWSQRNLLSLDGGGIRGYWSLLVLRRLMKAIADEERRQAPLGQEEFHSFWPQQFPEDVTHGPFEREEREELRRTQEEKGKSKAHTALRDARKFLPCHYFDIICGSSTGRMGDMIFGKPRLVSQRNIGIVRWPKYSAKAMEKAFKEVTARRCGRDENQHVAVTLPTIPGTCKMFVFPLPTSLSDSSGKRIKLLQFVTTMQRTKGPEISADTVYLIRSYDHFQKKNHKSLERQDTDGPKRNWGQRSMLEIWQVARAATAAPFYFKEIKFRQENHNGCTKIYFSDGGFGHTNNPTMLGIQEIEGLHGRPNVGVVVNIGTARADGALSGRGLFKRLAKGFNEATNPKIVDAWVTRERLGFYYRFNDKDGIPVELDEWKPNGWFTKHPGRDTLRDIENCFNAWIAHRKVLAQFNECARELVRRRRRRADDGSRWERYATGAQYRCQHQTCNRLFGYREDFEDHWLKVHGSDDTDDETRQPAVDPWKYQPQRNGS
ncbi:hypothetical protein K458DRAFT_293222 [Lentithecium fluviatile CBS 122367]|uniref:C2H2-type domain-containing protein n=1 Tax=Lentithecium fluviatile CBS 122367 TaxID=1168545 RepID=A0A6G1JDR1_9PLEO|nr:hypothetical protein K458DRAFT_293222 [Lentithecium fluviatile CBS 122367]